MGQAVEVNISGKWRSGRIVSSKVASGQPTKYKVKFDQHTQVEEPFIYLSKKSLVIRFRVKQTVGLSLIFLSILSESGIFTSKLIFQASSLDVRHYWSTL